jgi:selenocysteine-specific elongation factor
MDAARTLVMATAGHVDHGKSALILALTGTDPDRLEEEKQRGMTIDLGFACLETSAGRVAFVDVPGHLRFMRNMLAGVCGAEAAMLVVAGDDGPMPQTLEHLSVLRMLGISRGVVALTKCDLVEDDWLELVTEDLQSKLARSSLRGAPLVRVSSRTGEGLAQLRSELDGLLGLAPLQPDRGGAKLPVDRAFSLRGFGTVITGTLADGCLSVGDQLVLLPQGRKLRVRGLQQHNREVTCAYPGSRTGVNLAAIERRDIRRGDVLAAPGLLTVTTRFDARLETVPEVPSSLVHGDKVLLYHGTGEVAARVLLLAGKRLQPGESGMVQLRLARPIAAEIHDRFILRREPAGTVAGGVILNPEPDRRRLRDAKAIAGLTVRASADTDAVVLEALSEAQHGLTPRQLRQVAGSAEAGLRAAEDLIAAGEAVRAGDVVVGREAWSELAASACRLVGDHHRRHPLDRGLPRAELRNQLGLPAPVSSALVQHLLERDVLTDTDGRLGMPGHIKVPGVDDQRVIDAVLQLLSERPLAPPTYSELGRECALTAEIAHFLVASGTLIKAGQDTLVLSAAWHDALSQLRSYLAGNGKINIAEARTVIDANRRTVIALLDELDGARETRRVGDVHWSRSASQQSHVIQLAVTCDRGGVISFPGTGI